MKMDKKGFIFKLIGLIVVLLIIGGFVFFKYVYKEDNQEGFCGDGICGGDEAETLCVECSVDEGDCNAGCHMICEEDCEQLIGGCAGVSLEYTQECCDNWALENNIIHIQCVGDWIIVNNQCAWECGSS